MREWVLPDYKGGSIVNMMSSLLMHYGKRTGYGELKLLPAKELTAKTVVLFVIDGLGYEYLQKYGKNTTLWKHCKGPMTTVFPSTTAAAITTFTTGVAPQQHGITGWFVHLRLFGMVSAVLRMRGWSGDSMKKIPRELIFSTPEFYSVPTWIITQPHIARNIKRRPRLAVRSYKSMRGLFGQTRHAVKAKGEKFIYSYWAELDSLSHRHGCTSAIARKHLKKLDDEFRKFLKSIAGTDTQIILTADHGQMVTHKSRVIDVSKHKGITDALVLPLTGEPRMAYCYVRPAKTRQFEHYVRTKLSHACTLVPSDEAMRKGWFGLGKPNPELEHRIGDYMLIMKKDYIIMHVPPHEVFDYHVGNHGGLSSAEMLVPLVVVRP